MTAPQYAGLVKWLNMGDGTGSCCLLFGMVGDLEWAGVGSSAGCCMLLAMCCGLEMVAFGSNGSGPVLFVADNGLAMYCFL